MMRGSKRASASAGPAPYCVVVANQSIACSLLALPLPRPDASQPMCKHLTRFGNQQKSSEHYQRFSVFFCCSVLQSTISGRCRLIDRCKLPCSLQCSQFVRCQFLFSVSLLFSNVESQFSNVQYCSVQFIFNFSLSISVPLCYVSVMFSIVHFEFQSQLFQFFSVLFSIIIGSGPVKFSFSNQVQVQFSLSVSLLIKGSGSVL